MSFETAKYKIIKYRDADIRTVAHPELYGQTSQEVLELANIAPGYWRLMLNGSLLQKVARNRIEEFRLEVAIKDSSSTLPDEIHTLTATVDVEVGSQYDISKLNGLILDVRAPYDKIEITHLTWSDWSGTKARVISGFHATVLREGV